MSKAAPHLAVGQSAEDIAAQYLEKHGYVVVERNWCDVRGRLQQGEIDIIAAHPDEPRNLYVVEVKARSSSTRSGAFSPEAALTKQKIAKILHVTEAYAKEHAFMGTFIFCLIAINFEKGSDAYSLNFYEDMRF